MIDYPIYIGSDALTELRKLLEEGEFSQLIVLADAHTRIHCYPILLNYLPDHHLIEVQAGEKHKNLTTCSEIWEQMTQLQVDRKALVINLGGGVIGDMGGFVAGTYKRGIDFVQIPTTLLSQVDASVGGKLGIDFQGFKNHIGLFREPRGVFIDPDFLNTLSDRELRSGFAEVIKHHLIGDAEAWQKLKTQREIRTLDLAALIQHSVALKGNIVKADPFERGLRKALNFGHTIGHAIESFRLDTAAHLLHGEAIAAGMICESHLSFQRGLLSQQACDEVSRYILDIYDHTPVDLADELEIFARMKNDKKNQDGKILCSLLKGIGAAAVNQAITWEETQAALAYYRGVGE